MCALLLQWPLQQPLQHQVRGVHARGSGNSPGRPSPPAPHILTTPAPKVIRAISRGSYVLSGLGLC